MSVESWCHLFSVVYRAIQEWNTKVTCKQYMYNVKLSIIINNWVPIAPTYVYEFTNHKVSKQLSQITIRRQTLDIAHKLALPISHYCTVWLLRLDKIVYFFKRQKPGNGYFMTENLVICRTTQLVFAIKRSWKNCHNNIVCATLVAFSCHKTQDQLWNLGFSSQWYLNLDFTNQFFYNKSPVFCSKKVFNDKESENRCKVSSLVWYLYMWYIWWEVFHRWYA